MRRAFLIIIVAVLVIAFYVGTNMYAYEAAFKKAPVGDIEVKTIPGSMLLSAEKEGNYFDRDNELFMSLFRYIQDNNVSMTVPVEAEIEKAQMRFYVGSKDQAKDLQNRPGVQVISVPQRTVVSIGIRGSYSKSNFEEAKIKLENWLKNNNDYKQTGVAYAVYWDAPFIPWFLKRSEVHIPIAAKDEAH